MKEPYVGIVSATIGLLFAASGRHTDDGNRGTIHSNELLNLGDDTKETEQCGGFRTVWLCSASAMRRHIQRITNRYGFVATLDTTGVTLISSGDLRDG